MSVPKQCYKCGARTEVFVTWAKHPVGWFCEEHDPRQFTGRTLRQMIEGSLRDDSDDCCGGNDDRPDAPLGSCNRREKLHTMDCSERPGEPVKYLVPKFWTKPRHPFREAVREMVSKGLAMIDETITIELGPKDDPTLNRAQRRALKRRM